MGFYHDESSSYISRKLDLLTSHFGMEQIKLLINLYKNIPNSNQKSLFSIIHSQLNRLFQEMNSRIRKGHYKADHSRELLLLIDEIKVLIANLEGTDYAFKLEPYYDERLKEIKVFLSTSNGSNIPDGFEEINITETKPIFYLVDTVEIETPEKSMSLNLKAIGNGSYANAYKYKDLFYNRYFVVKKAFKNLTDNEYERFKIEYEEMKKLNSPYVIEVYRFNEEKREYIMEFADITLETYVSKNNEELNMDERINLVHQIIKAFGYIHSKGVLHRDISTTNTLIKFYDGLKVVKISDFGLVKRKESKLTRVNTLKKGSLNDPQLAVDGFGNYEIRHETYALTRLIYFVLTGKSNIEREKNIVLKTFIKKGTSPDINERFKDTEELKRAFKIMSKSL